MDEQRRHIALTVAAAALATPVSRATAQQEKRQRLPGEPFAEEFGWRHMQSTKGIYEATKPDRPQSFPGARKLLKFVADNKLIAPAEAGQINDALNLLEKAESDLGAVIKEIRASTVRLAKEGGEAANGIINILLSSYDFIQEHKPKLSSAETRLLIISDVGGGLATAAAAILSGLPQFALVAILLGAGGASAAELVTLENQKLQSGRTAPSAASKPIP